MSVASGTNQSFACVPKARLRRLWKNSFATHNLTSVTKPLRSVAKCADLLSLVVTVESVLPFSPLFRRESKDAGRTSAARHEKHSLWHVSNSCKFRSQDCDAIASEQSTSELRRRQHEEEFQAYPRGVPLGRKCRSGEKRPLWVDRFLREAESPRVAMPQTHRVGGV